MSKKQINETLRRSNEESRKFTRDCICTALIHLMSTQEYDKITITAIINRSGVSRAAFYRNFTSKEDVLKDVMDHLWTEMNHLFNNPKFLDNPRQQIIDYFSTLDENSRALYLLTKTEFSLDNFLDDDNLKEFKNTFSTESYYKHYMFIHAFWALLTEWCQRGMKETPEQLANILIDALNIDNILKRG